MLKKHDKNKHQLKLTPSSISKNLKRNVSRDEGVNQVDKHLAELDANSSAQRLEDGYQMALSWGIQVSPRNYTYISKYNLY